VTTSAFADVFIRLFVLGDDKKTTLPAPEWGANEGQFQLRVIKLTHQTHGYSYEIESAANTAIRNWLEERRASAHHEIKSDPKIYERYVGEYQVGSNAPFDILVQNGKLVRQGRSYDVHTESFFIKYEVTDDNEIDDFCDEIFHLGNSLNLGSSVSSRSEPFRRNRG